MSLPSFPAAVPSPPQPERIRGFVLHRRIDTHDGPALPGGQAGHDKDLGELEEVIELNGRSYFVVDARHWSFGTRKLVPVGAVAAVDLVRRRAWTGLELDLIRRSPDFDPFLLSSGPYADRVTRYWDGVSPAAREA